MKNIPNKILSLVLVLVLLLSAMPAAMAAEEVGFTGTVGAKEQFQFYQNYEDIIVSAKTTKGSVPGMEVTTINNATAELTGTPSKAGSYTLEVTLETEKSGTLEYVLKVTISDSGAKTLAVTKHPTDEEVAEGSSVTFIARADNARQYEWEFTTAKGSVMLCKNLPDTFSGLKVTGANTEKLVMTNVPLDFDGGQIRCRFINGEESTYSNYASIKVKEAEDLPPTVTKHPTGETVTEGGRAVFIAKADNVDTYDWQLLDENDGYYSWEEARDEFPELEVTGETTERIVLTEIPLSLDGFKLQCLFKGPGGETTSKAATLAVTPEDALPEITKHPTGETVTEGESAVFVAKAKYAEKFVWQLVSPDGTVTLDATSVSGEFKDLKMTGHDTERLTLENIPLEFSGWKVQCKFEASGGSATSEAATVTVNPDPDKPTETTEATTEAPTEETTEEPTTEEPTEAKPTEEADGPITTIGANKDKGGGLKNVLLVTLIVLGAAVLGAGAAALVVLLRQRRQ